MAFDIAFKPTNVEIPGRGGQMILKTHLDLLEKDIALLVLRFHHWLLLPYAVIRVK